MASRQSLIISMAFTTLLTNGHSAFRVNYPGLSHCPITQDIFLICVFITSWGQGKFNGLSQRSHEQQVCEACYHWRLRLLFGVACKGPYPQHRYQSAMGLKRYIPWPSLFCGQWTFESRECAGTILADHITSTRKRFNECLQGPSYSRGQGFGGRHWKTI